MDMDERTADQGLDFLFRFRSRDELTLRSPGSGCTPMRRRASRFTSTMWRRGAIGKSA
jgi:hypothetical protein